MSNYSVEEISASFNDAPIFLKIGEAIFAVSINESYGGAKESGPVGDAYEASFTDSTFGDMRSLRVGVGAAGEVDLNDALIHKTQEVYADLLARQEGLGKEFSQSLRKRNLWKMYQE